MISPREMISRVWAGVVWTERRLALALQLAGPLSQARGEEFSGR